MALLIERPSEVKRINSTRKWILVYGRRKTGKSFLVENFISYDDYFFVKRDRSIISKRDDQIISYESLKELLKRGMEDDKTIIVDEFHRLGGDFQDFLHAARKGGKLILISSTLFLSKKIMGSGSPLLGFFAENPVWLIELKDTIAALKKYKLTKKALLELAVLLREPLALEYFEEKTPPDDLFVKVLQGSVRTVPALVGEIFIEEERGISSAYEGILRAIANGKVISGEISSYLFSRGLVKKDDPSLIQQYLENLIRFGIIRRVKVLDKNRFTYKHSSPLARLFYYADDKYNISEKPANPPELRRIVDEILPKVMEDQLREFLAASLGLDEAVAEGKDYDVDACLLKFKRPTVVVEIKWKDNIDEEDVRKAENSLDRVNADEKWLMVPDKNEVRIKTKLKIVDAMDFI
jgi:uncharacterized protein